MAAGRLIVPGWMPALDEDGNPIPNARVFFYLNKTTTLAAVFSDEAMTVPLVNPVPSNASGRFPAVWANDSVLYSVSVDAPYGPAGIPFTYDDLSASMAADILVAGAAEAAADEAQQSLVEIQATIDAAMQAGGGEAAVAGAIAGAAAGAESGESIAQAVVSGKVNTSGDNTASSFPENAGVERVVPVIQGLSSDPVANADVVQSALAGFVSPVFRSPGQQILVNHPNSTGGSGSNPDDSAILVNRNIEIVGQGTQQTVFKASQTDTYFNVFRSYILPISDREPDLLGGGYADLQIDGSYDTEDPANQASWVHSDSSAAILASGVRDYSFKNLLLTNLTGYGLGLQNGRHQRLRIQNVVIDGTMNDGIDQKNNYSRSRDNLFQNIWAYRWGRGTNPTAGYAGVDVMSDSPIIQNVWFKNFGGVGSADAAIRLKQGEVADGRGLGAYRALVHSFQIEGETALVSNSVGVHSAHRRSIIGHGNLDNLKAAAIRLDQEQATVYAINGHNAGNGVWVKSDDETTFADFAMSFGVRMTGSTYGYNIERHDGFHVGVDLADNTTHVRFSGNRNFLMGQVRGTGTKVSDVGTGNTAALWHDGKLNFYRAGAIRYKLGDYIEHHSASGEVIESWTHAGRETTLNAPTGANGNFTYNTPDGWVWRVDGLDAFSLNTAGGIPWPRVYGPLQLRSYSINQLPSAANHNQSIVYCSNGDAGSPCLAFSNGTNWLRILLGATVSPT